MQFAELDTGSYAIYMVSALEGAKQVTLKSSLSEEERRNMREDHDFFYNLLDLPEDEEDEGV